MMSECVLNLTRYMPKYKLNIEQIDDNYFSLMCNVGIREDGTEKLLHNEIGCEFVVEDGKMVVLSGWHIGTEDFEWNEKGYDWVLEEYHPGITEQLLREIGVRNECILQDKLWNRNGLVSKQNY